MTQRNPMNDRYTEENRTGKTRKSSASAKPKAERAATVREPAPKTKEQKKKERKERERKEAEKAQALNGRFEQTEGYKTLRRIWWGCLIGAIFRHDKALPGMHFPGGKCGILSCPYFIN